MSHFLSPRVQSGLVIGWILGGLLACPEVVCSQEPAPSKPPTTPVATTPVETPPVGTGSTAQDPAPPTPNPKNPATAVAGAAESGEPRPPKLEVVPATVDSQEVSREEPTRRKLPNLGSLMNERIPGQPWRIHDATRPRPKRLLPPEQPSLPPPDAIVLFDGKGLEQWCHRSDDELYEPNWVVRDGVLEIRPGAGNLHTLDGYGSCHVHLEYRIPEGTQGISQNRGNSGIKLMDRFEVQILDTYENRTYADGQAGAIYGQYPPLVNAAKPAGAWQSFEIIFEAPVFEGEVLKSSAFMTVFHNGILVHHHRELPGPTGARTPAYHALPPAAPIMLQDHGSPIQFRNIWLRSL